MTVQPPEPSREHLASTLVLEELDPTLSDCDVSVIPSLVPSDFVFFSLRTCRTTGVRLCFPQAVGAGAGGGHALGLRGAYGRCARRHTQGVVRQVRQEVYIDALYVFVLDWTRFFPIPSCQDLPPRAF